jgi:hypothetical protein
LTPRNTYETKYPAENRKKTRRRAEDVMCGAGASFI